MNNENTYKLPKIEIRNNNKHGQGTFACEKICGGGRIMVLDGKIVTFDECMSSIELGQENIDDPLQIAEWLFIDLDEPSRAINHSCEPNAGLRNRSELFALRDIMPDEEITYDYSSVVGPNITPDMWTMECSCGAPSCRKIIGNVLSIPKVRFQMYLKAGAFQHHIMLALKLTANESNS